MVYVITINYNLHKDTIQCVNSILQSEFKDIHIYLVDNGSEDEDYKFLKQEFTGHQKVTVLRIEKNCGYVGGVNYGIKMAMENSPEYIMIMNNDTILDKSAVGHLISACRRHSDRAIVSGMVYYYEHPDIIQHTGVQFKDHRFFTTSYPGKNEKDLGQFSEEQERDSLDDVFWLFPAKLIGEIGMYSEYFYLYAEQGDFAQRARRIGYKLVFTPEAKIWHKESMTIGAGNAKALHIYFWRGQAQYIFQFRNLKTKYFIILVIKTILEHTIKSLFRMGLDRKRAFAQLRGYLRGFLWMFNKRPNTGYNPYFSK